MDAWAARGAYKARAPEIAEEFGRSVRSIMRRIWNHEEVPQNLADEMNKYREQVVGFLQELAQKKLGQEIAPSGVVQHIEMLKNLPENPTDRDVYRVERAVPKIIEELNGTNSLAPQVAEAFGYCASEIKNLRKKGQAVPNALIGKMKMNKDETIANLQEISRRR